MRKTKPLPKYFFDHNGLRFSAHILNKAKQNVNHLTESELAEYVDAITYDMVERGRTIIPANVMNTVSFGSNVNITSLGNTAFVKLYHSNELQRELAGHLLNKLCAYYKLHVT